jgi:hypothetical protein
MRALSLTFGRIPLQYVTVFPSYIHLYSDGPAAVFACLGGRVTDPIRVARTNEERPFLEGE